VPLIMQMCRVKMLLVNNVDTPPSKKLYDVILFGKEAPWIWNRSDPCRPYNREHLWFTSTTDASAFPKASRKPRLYV